MQGRVSVVFNNDREGPFAPAFVLPAQFYAQASAASGEQRLAAAVLEEALQTLRRYRGMDNPRAVRLCRDAEQWIFESHDGAYSFSLVCEALKLDPDAVRAAVRQRTVNVSGMRRVGHGKHVTLTRCAVAR